MGKDAILADRRALSDRLVGEGGLLLPGSEAIQPAKMVNVILRVTQLDRVRGHALQTDFTAEHRASLFVSALHQKPASRGAMASIHLKLLSTSKHYL
jgi:hypothetical protein